MSLLKRIVERLRFSWHLLFFAMKGGDDMLFGHESDDGDSLIERQVKGGGVYKDLLEQKVTQEVEELRDKNYRVLREADLYDPTTISMVVSSDGSVVDFTNTQHVAKKRPQDFLNHVPVYIPDGTSLLLIQDNRLFEGDNNSTSLTAVYGYDTLLDIERDNITPRFEIDKFVKKIVVRDVGICDRRELDLYVPCEASQFGKIDAMLIANLYRMWESKDFRSDIVEFKTISFVTYKAWGVEDLFQYRFDDIKMVDMNVFDGSFVLTFNAHVDIDGKYIPEKYKTVTMDKKYAEKAPKSDTFVFDVNNFKNKKLF